MGGPDIVLARFSNGSVLAVLFAVCLSALVVGWIAVAYSGLYSKAVLLAVAAACGAYYLWRLIVILYARALKASRAIYVRDGAIYGLSLHATAIADLGGVTLRRNEVGRSVLTLQLKSGSRIRGVVSGLEPSPTEIKRAVEALIQTSA